jgi:hypothetical protein
MKCPASVKPEGSLPISQECAAGPVPSEMILSFLERAKQSSASTRCFLTFRNVLSICGAGLLASTAYHNLKNHQLLVRLYTFAATRHLWRQSPPSANLRTCYAEMYCDTRNLIPESYILKIYKLNAFCLNTF